MNRQYTPERRVNHLAAAVMYETPTEVLRSRRISLLGFDPAVDPTILAEIARIEASNRP